MSTAAARGTGGAGSPGDGSSSSSSTSMFQSYTRGSSGLGGSSSASENLPPRTLARVSREIRDLYKNPPEGVRLVVDGDSGVPGSLNEVMAEIEGPTGTPYESRYFQLKLVLSADFPASPPRGYFLTKIYHPNVDMSTGAICVNTLKKDWTSATTFCHVLSVVRCLLIVPFPESSLNDEAGKLFMDSYEEYARRAKIMAGVHGRPRPSSGGSDGDQKKAAEDGSESPTGKPPASSLPNSARSLGSSASGKAVRGGSRSGSLRGIGNIKKGAMDKKSKKKSLKRL